MRIYIGADHQGFRLKQKLVDYLAKHGYEVEDRGDNKLDIHDDFPEFAARVVNAMKSSSDDEPRGILLCGSGQGMVMAANRHKGMYAALCWDKRSAKESRNDDNSNVLCLPAHLLSQAEVYDIVETWLNTPFESLPRRVRRLKQIDEQ